LPADVIADIEGNRKVSAIKRLRAQRGIGLAEAKQIVDAYIEKHPSSLGLQAPESEGGVGRILILIIGVGVIYGLYNYFT
ncbi:MAG: ribosomal protein L7/L12, partial [Halioglobus sp.]|nr:ribosomal protein L7/L12 [Halioglobus sp.]